MSAAATPALARGERAMSQDAPIEIEEGRQLLAHGYYEKDTQPRHIGRGPAKESWGM